jgi:hypothetical protein
MLINILYVLTFVAVGYVVFTLIMGARSMGAKKREDTSESAAASNLWMTRRVKGQLVAIGLLCLILLVKKNGG